MGLGRPDGALRLEARPKKESFMKASMFAALLALGLAAGCGGKSVTNAASFYVVGASTNEVLMFQERGSGAITPLQVTPTIATGSIPVSIVVHPAKEFAYVANNADGFNADGTPAGGTITSFIRNKGTGELSVPPLPPNATATPTPAVAGAHPVALSVVPSGQFLLALDQGTQGASQGPSQIFTFSIAPVNDPVSPGALTSVGTAVSAPVNPTLISPVTMEPVPPYMTIAPNGQFLFVVNPSAATISEFLVDSKGNVTPNGTFPAGMQPVWAAVNPQGQFLYVADLNGNQVLGFNIQAGTGALTPIAGSPFAAGTAPSALAIDSTGSILLAANGGSNNVSSYTITNSGALTAVPGSPFTAGITPGFVTFDPTNTFVYVANRGSHDISAFGVVPSGVLKGLLGSPFGVGIDPTWIATTF